MKKSQTIINSNLKNITNAILNSTSNIEKANLKKRLKENIEFIKSNFLKKNNYFFIIKGFKSDKNYEKKVKLLAYCMGNVIIQNYKNNKFVKVTPKVNLIKKLSKVEKKDTLRYHETNSGGSIHSDGPQLSIPPNYVFLACIKESNSGGKSIISNCIKIFNELKKKDPNSLKTLMSKYYFERRGFNFKSKIFSKPIFELKKNNLRFRYLREYIETAYKMKKTKMSKNKIIALNKLDKLLTNEKFQKRFKLSTGDIVIFNNQFLSHGRTKFKINKNSSQRALMRVWVN